MSPKESSLAFDEVKELVDIQPHLRLVESRFKNSTSSLSRVLTTDEANDVVIIGGRITVSF